MAGKRSKGKKSIVKWIAGAAAVFLLLAAAGFFVQIRDVTVTGNNRCSSEEITRILFPTPKERSLVYCYLKDRFGEHEKIPYVEDYDLVFESPTRVEVICQFLISYLPLDALRRTLSEPAYALQRPVHQVCL